MTEVQGLRHYPGNGRGNANRPLVLVHGFTSNGEADFVSTGLVKNLNEAGLDVSVLDLPGHGAGRGVPSERDGRLDEVLRGLSTQLREAAGHWGSDLVDVLGYSLGARLAWELERAGANVGKLVLGGLSPFDPFASLDVQALRKIVAGEREAADPLLGMMSQMVARPGADTESLLNLVAGLSGSPFDPEATAPRVPVLLLAGAEDQMSAGVESLESLLGDARLRTVPGDHQSALGSVEFGASIVQFLS